MARLDTTIDLNLATRIQHAPSRARVLPELLERLDGLDPQVITDPGGPRPSSWRSHRACLESIPDDASHLLCVQDDAWPCDGFPALARAAIAERPDVIVAFFVPGFGHLARLVGLARKRRVRWLDLPRGAFVPLVGVAYPRTHVEAIPAFADAKRIGVGRADDGVVAQYVRANKLPVSATCPSLVEHRDEIPSAMQRRHGHGQQHRLACWYDETGGAWRLQAQAIAVHSP